ncbi:MAG TPA: N-formylglutamate amidohydrolase [Kiloniellales bacterium]|nr:N-formylglutamate amidohydrolase [Kiloniellales bacterium]
MDLAEAAPSESVEICNRTGSGPLLLLCEHASHEIPERYKGLGLDPAHALSHAAWDPGARAVALKLSHALNSPLVASRVSRLVYDCNRPPHSRGAMPERSEVVEVPGNRDLTPDQREERIASVYRPFCDAVSRVLAERKARGLSTLLVTVHSFTPVFHGKPREVELGILHDSDSRLADIILAQADRLPHRNIQRNAPYTPEDEVTHSLKLHGIENGLLNVMIEMRNDLLRTPEEEAAMAEELLQLIRPALAALQPDTLPPGGNHA